jgi:hypothetical protein
VRPSLPVACSLVALGALLTHTLATARSSFGALDAALAAGGAEASARYASLYAALDRFQAAVLSALDVTAAQIA